MDATPGANFGQLMQYGAVGVVAAGLLTLVVIIFRQLVTHALDQSKQLAEQLQEQQKRDEEIHKAYIKSLNEIAVALSAIRIEVTRDLGQLFNEISAMTEGSRAHRIRPSGGSGSSGGVSGGPRY